MQNLHHNVNAIPQCMPVETRLTEANQTQVPAQFRARFGLGPGDVVVWEEVDGEIHIRFRKRYRLEDLVGAFESHPKTGELRPDAVADKKRAQRGELKRTRRNGL